MGFLKFTSQLILCGGLLGVGFLIPGLWTLGFFGVAYFYYLFTQLLSKKAIFFGGLTVWTIKALCALFWFWTTYPVSWLSVPLGGAQLSLIFFYWFTCALWLGFGGVLVGGFLNTATKSSKVSRYTLLLYPLVWVAGEAFGSVMFSLMTLGPGGSINPYFSFGYIGYLLAEHETFLQLARVGGLYSLTFFMALVATVSWYLSGIVSRHYRYGFLAAALFLTATASLSPLGAEDLSEKVTVATIDTRLTAQMLQEKDATPEIGQALEQAVALALEAKPTYLLLPEGIEFFRRLDPTLSRAFFKFKHPDVETIIIDSGTNETQVGRFLQAAVYDPVQQKEYVADKRYLVPQGEFMPYFHEFVLRLIGKGEIVSQVKANVSYIVGDNTSQSTLPAIMPSILFCFESASPLGVRTLLRERDTVPFVVHPVSHSWFHEPDQLRHQADTMLKIHALWNDVAIVMVANESPGRLVTEQGKIELPQVLGTSQWWTVGLFEVSVKK